MARGDQLQMCKDFSVTGSPGFVRYGDATPPHDISRHEIWVPQVQHMVRAAFAPRGFGGILRIWLVCDPHTDHMLHRLPAKNLVALEMGP